jgi:ribosomal protein L5
VEKREEIMAARLKEKYHSEIKTALQKDLGLQNAMAVPKLEKIVINMGLGEATQNVKIMDPLLADLGALAGQKPVITKAKKSIAAFKLREGMPIGAMVTLRGDTMYEFLDRLGDRLREGRQDQGYERHDRDYVQGRQWCTRVAEAIRYAVPRWRVNISFSVLRLRE